MTDKKFMVERTYDWYRGEINGWGLLCYYGLVTEAFLGQRKLTPEIDFQDFDDAFLKELAGLKPEDELPLKSNEIFDDTYWHHLVSWYYLPCNAPDSYNRGVISFMAHVKSGKLEPYTEYYEREYR